jgi:clan AA aspartic protease
MTVGSVTDTGELIVWVRVHGPRGFTDVAAVLDTGYDGWLTLPAEIVTELGLRWHSRTDVKLADGVVKVAEVYEAEIEWGGERRWTRVTLLPDSLLGTALLFGHELRAEFTPGGAVELRPLA